LDMPAERSLAFALEPKLVVIAAVPGLRIPQIEILTLADPRLEPLEHDGAERHVVHALVLGTRPRHGGGSEDRVCRMARSFEGPVWRLGRGCRLGVRPVVAMARVFHRAVVPGPVFTMIHRVMVHGLMIHV